MSKKEKVEIRFKEDKKIYDLLLKISSEEGCSVPELYRKQGKNLIYTKNGSLPKTLPAQFRSPISVHVNEQESTIVNEYSQNSGLSKSSTMRRGIRLLDDGHADLLKDEVDAINDAIRAVDRIGRNYNQHLALINQGKAKGVPKEALMGAIKNLQNLKMRLDDFEEAVKNRRLPSD